MLTRLAAVSRNGLLFTIPRSAAWARKKRHAHSLVFG